MVVDASVWVAALLANDARHLEAAGFLHELVIGGADVSVPLLALSEVAGAIARQTGDAAVAEQAVAFLREQTWIQLAPLNEALATLAASIAAHQKLRGADAIYVGLAAQGDAALITLDREMLERAPDGVIATTPSAWLKQTH
jgi:predicted nucleic acid-binding protein